MYKHCNDLRAILICTNSVKRIKLLLNQLSRLNWAQKIIFYVYDRKRR